MYDWRQRLGDFVLTNLKMSDRMCDRSGHFPTEISMCTGIQETDSSFQNSESDSSRACDKSSPNQKTDSSTEQQHVRADDAYRYQRSKKRTNLPDDFELIDDDVLCGRGKDSFHHPGNRRFRKVVSMHVHKYDAAGTKKEKTTIVKQVIDTLRKRGGIFCKKDAKTGKYYQVGETDCRVKVGHALRDSMSARRTINMIHQQQGGVASEDMQTMEPINPYEEVKSQEVDMCFAEFLQGNSLFSESFSGDELDSSRQSSVSATSEDNNRIEKGG